MRPQYEKIEIHGESDLPKKNGIYFVKLKTPERQTELTAISFIWESNPTKCNPFWINKVDWYLQPIEVDNSIEPISDEKISYDDLYNAIPYNIENIVLPDYVREDLANIVYAKLRSQISQPVPEITDKIIDDYAKTTLATNDEINRLKKSISKIYRFIQSQQVPKNTLKERIKPFISDEESVVGRMIREDKEKEVPENKYPVYTLNCDKCKQPYYCADAFPEDQLCTKCFAEKYLKREEVHPEVSAEEWYDKNSMNYKGIKSRHSAIQIIKDFHAVLKGK